ncbi:MAG: phosphate signaling complex protein PhoU [Verrucomicrobiaceae bacterium]
MNDTPHILSSFDKALGKLNQDIRHMAAVTMESINDSARALARRDEDLCNRVIADDEIVDVLEKQIDSEGINLMTRFMPLAHDFRRVFATMKVAADLERVCDQAVNIARRVKRLLQSPELPESRMIEPIHVQAAALLQDSIRAFNEENMELARSLKARDKELDRAHKELIERLTRRMEEDPLRVQDYLDLVFIIRFLERAGDHAVNIGEDAVYAGTARDVRHEKSDA